MEALAPIAIWNTTGQPEDVGVHPLFKGIPSEKWEDNENFLYLKSVTQVQNICLNGSHTNGILSRQTRHNSRF